MNSNRRFRRSAAATVATLGAVALLAAHASAAPTVETIPLAADAQPAQPEGIVSGPDGNLYFADFALQHLYRIAPNASSATDLGGPSGTIGPARVAASPTSIWVSGFTSAVASYSPGAGFAPNIPLAPAPLAPANLRGIAYGSDGKVWTVGKDDNQIWKIDPAVTGGATTPFSLQGSTVNEYTRPESVAAGAGVLYVTQGGGTGRVAKVTTVGTVVSTFRDEIPEAYGVTVGPGDDIYVTSGSNAAAALPGKVWKLDPTNGSGGSTTLPAGSNPRGIITGPDGALWFAQGDNKVGRLTVDGSLSDVDVPGCTTPDSLAVGASNTIYVTCFGSARLVRISPDGTAPPLPPPPAPPVTPAAPVTPAPVTPTTPTIAKAKTTGKLKLAKSVKAGKALAVQVTFSNALSRGRVKVLVRSVNTKPKSAIKSFKTVGNKLVSGTIGKFSVKFSKPGTYYLKVTFANGGATQTAQQVKVVVTAPKKG